MPDRDMLWLVSKYATKAADLREQRDDTIRDAVANGHSLRAVAEAAGLSHAAIARIVKR